MVLYGTINVYGLGYGSQDNMNFIFFSSVFMSFSPLRVPCIGVLRAFAWSSIWLPSYHKLHIWLGYGCQERFMVVSPGRFQPRI